MISLPVRPRSLNDSFQYACNGCGRCCIGKSISVGPYEVARLAEVMGVSTTDALAQCVDLKTSTLRRSDDDTCIHYEAGQCSVHSGRPLTCRLYPLGWITTPAGDHVYVVSPDPESAGVYGDSGTIRDYLHEQGTPPFETRASQYEVVLWRAEAAQTVDGPDPGNPPLLMDVDAAVRADCDARGRPVPDDVEARVDLHLALLHRWLDAAGAPRVTA